MVAILEKELLIQRLTWALPWAKSLLAVFFVFGPALTVRLIGSHIYRKKFNFLFAFAPYVFRLSSPGHYRHFPEKQAWPLANSLAQPTRIELRAGLENEQRVYQLPMDEKYVTFSGSVEWETQGSTIKCHLQ